MAKNDICRVDDVPKRRAGIFRIGSRVSSSTDYIGTSVDVGRRISMIWKI